jgi:hypothetical protein
LRAAARQQATSKTHPGMKTIPSSWLGPIAFISIPSNRLHHHTKLRLGCVPLQPTIARRRGNRPYCSNCLFVPYNKLHAEMKGKTEPAVPQSRRRRIVCIEKQLMESRWMPFTIPSTSNRHRNGHGAKTFGLVLQEEAFPARYASRDNVTNGR